MSRVVVVSNRVSDPLQAAQAGGVAVAIGDCLRVREGVWFGWTGTIDDDASDVQIIEGGDGQTLRVTLPLTQDEFNAYYLGYANSVLWPVFHNRVDLAQFEAGYFTAYSRVNSRFAKALAQIIKPDDVIWVHDYHFLTLGQELRSLGVTNRIGFFLHIPFPPSQSFAALPEHRTLAHALAAFDLVGLQTSTDISNFIDYLEHGARGQLLPDGRMRVDGREFRIGSFPVGIDSAFFHTQAKNPGMADDHVRLIGVDRLDYTKGLPQKFRAFGRFLERYPEYRNKSVLTQIAAPSRESVEAYTDIRRELESLSGSINGTYGDLEWVPIHYINRTASRDRLARIYRASAIGLVTPLRDGMNLVAKEYVSAQASDNPGVLILSQFAGAAEELDAALIVNPYNVEEISDAIFTALQMPADERRSRHGSMMSRINGSSAAAWATSFLDALSGAAFPGAQIGIGFRLKDAVDALSRSARHVSAALPPFSHVARTADIPLQSL